MRSPPVPPADFASLAETSVSKLFLSLTDVNLDLHCGTVVNNHRLITTVHTNNIAV
jgi:hypothetical protein